MPSPFFADATALQLVIPIMVGLVIVGLISLLPEPAHQKFTPVFLLGAGAAYLSGGSGLCGPSIRTVFTISARRADAANPLTTEQSK